MQISSENALDLKFKRGGWRGGGVERERGLNMTCM